MKRGVLELSKKELQTLFTYVDVNSYKGLPLYEKLLAAKNMKEEPIKIFLSEEEFDNLYDIFAIPDENDSDDVKDLRKAFMKLMQQFQAESV